MLPWHPPPSLHVQQQQQGVSELNGVGEQASNGNATNNNLTNGGGQQQPPMTLANVLHFLQSEHRRYARDRNEWEIERAEMRARIALLEGEKRGNEGALRDLGRRCRMLENALRGERSKQIQQLQQQQQQQQASSGTSSPAPPPAAAAAPNPATTAGNANSRASSALGIHPNNPTTAPAAAPPAAGNTLGKDPRGRARSREYLKQCLQEITYLTSQTTLNPLSSASHLAPNVPRPKKVLPSLSEVGPGAQPTTATSSAPQPGIITLPPVVTAPSTTTSAAPGETSAYVPLKRQVSSPLTSSSATSATNDHEQQATIPQTNPSEEDPTDPFIPRTEESLTSDVTTSEGTIVSEDHLVQQPWQYGSSIY